MRVVLSRVIAKGANRISYAGLIPLCAGLLPPAVDTIVALALAFNVKLSRPRPNVDDVIVRPTVALSQTTKFSLTSDYVPKAVIGTDFIAESVLEVFFELLKFVIYRSPSLFRKSFGNGVPTNRTVNLVPCGIEPSISAFLTRSRRVHKVTCCVSANLSWFVKS